MLLGKLCSKVLWGMSLWAVCVHTVRSAKGGCIWGHLCLGSEKAMAPHSSTLAWKIPWTEEPGGLQSMGSLRVGHDWVNSLSRTGEGNGNPLQCSCLENPREGGAWWAAVYGVTQSQTRLKRLSSSSSSMFVLSNIGWTKGSFRFSLTSYGKTQMNILTNPKIWRMSLIPQLYLFKLLAQRRGEKSKKIQNRTKHPCIPVLPLRVSLLLPEYLA